MDLPLNPWEWLASNFSLPYHTWIKHYGQENKGADHWPKKLLIVGQILHVSILGNVYRTVWRICILMLGCKGFSYIASGQNPLIKFTVASSSCLELVTLFIMPVHTGLSCCPVVQRPISANPWLNCNLDFFIPLFKSIFGIIFCVLLTASNDCIFFKSFQI